MYSGINIMLDGDIKQLHCNANYSVKIAYVLQNAVLKGNDMQL